LSGRATSGSILRHASRPDGYLEHAFRATAKEVICIIDSLEREAMCQQGREVNATASDDLLATRTERCDRTPTETPL